LSETDGGGKVIRVLFGRGGGRLDAVAGAATPATAPAAKLFTRAQVARMSGLSPARLSSLSRALVVCPTGRDGRSDAYTFTDLAQLRVVRGLLDRGARMRDIVSAVRAVRQALPEVEEPLLALRFEVEERRLLVRSGEGAFEPLTGQGLLDLQPRRSVPVIQLRPSEGGERARHAYDLYLRASEIDEDPERLIEAEALYRRAIELDPWLSIAYTNLGNILFRRHDSDAAAPLYRKALELDSRQPEAQYNLGYLTLEGGDAARAIPLFLAAIDCDPKFADAYFNLAMALEQVERDDEAQRYWREYLALSPSGCWSEIARRHLR
jgi:tetratricopeptide (TPR) repeat protein